MQIDQQELNQQAEGGTLRRHACGMRTPPTVLTVCAGLWRRKSWGPFFVRRKQLQVRSRRRRAQSDVPDRSRTEESATPRAAAAR